MNLKPFNLEKALAGDPVVTRCGIQVTEIVQLRTALATDRPIIGVVNGIPRSFRIDGTFCEGYVFPDDLFMAPKIVKKSGWLNVYPNNTVVGYAVGYRIYSSKENADAGKCEVSNRVACIFVEWEEEE